MEKVENQNLTEKRWKTDEKNRKKKKENARRRLIF